MSHRRLPMTLAVAGAVVCFAVADLAHSLSTASKDLFAQLQISQVMAGTPAAAFDLESLDGRSVRSTDLAGKVVLLNFWATWCGPCKEEMPSLARLQAQLDPQRFRVVTVTTDMHRLGITQFLAHMSIGLPVLLDADQEVSRMYMVRGLPTTVLLGPDGRPVGRAVGPRAWDSQDAVALIQQVIQGTP